MTYWRMQLHPTEPAVAVAHTVKSLVAGYIGLDFDTDVGDLTRTTQDALPQRQKDYWAFASEMEIGDRVLIIVHHFPFALATVAVNTITFANMRLRLAYGSATFASSTTFAITPIA